VDTCSLRNIDNEVDVGVVVVIASSWYFHISVGHPDVFGVDAQIFRSRHDGEFDLSIRAKSLVRPFSNGSNFFDSCNTVVGDEDLKMSTALLQIEAGLTLVITV
jgi:hypothetical protein